jgi:hypothetical protein
MGFIANIQPYVVSVLQTVPAAYQTEVSDAMCDRFGFEDWRLAQDPVVDDTPANRLDFVGQMLASEWAVFIINTTTDARSVGIEDQTWLDIELG